MAGNLGLEIPLTGHAHLAPIFTHRTVKEQWGKLTDDDLLQIEGRRDQLVGKIQTRYGISHEQAEAQVSAWEQKRSRDM
jgi:uncharacterized protein YjbJ (UPF0337 family)